MDEQPRCVICGGTVPNPRALYCQEHIQERVKQQVKRLCELARQRRLEVGRRLVHDWWVITGGGR